MPKNRTMGDCQTDKKIYEKQDAVIWHQINNS